MNKKGIELQFHWIFIMVAGALILTFFTTIAQKQYTLSVQKSEYSLVNSLETLFSVALKTPNTLNELKISSSIEFSCTEYGCSYKIGNSELPFYNKIIFSAQKQEGDLKLWTLDFEKPFRVATMLMISSSETKYYLVSNEDEADKLLERIPREINIEKVQAGSVQNIQHSGEKYTRFIYYQTTIRSLHNSFADKNVDAIELGQGTVNFYSYENGFTNKGSASYSQDDASIFAAIFSANKEMYEYQMKKVFKRTADVAEVYKKRTEILSNPPNCLYDSGKIQAIMTLTNTPDIFKFTELDAAASQLENENQVKIIQGCPEIY